MSEIQRALWETPQFQRVAGKAWRPGGTKLTDTALCWLAEHNLLPAHGLAVDLGCGRGASLTLLTARGFTAIGLDKKPQTDPEIAAAGLICADIEHIPLRANIADLVLLECVLSLVQDPLTVLRKSFDLLKPGGICLCADLIQRNNLPSCAENTTGCFAGARAPSTWRDLLSLAGLNLLREENHDWAVRELLARLIWYSSASPCLGTKRTLGYGLWLSQKPV